MVNAVKGFQQKNQNIDVVNSESSSKLGPEMQSDKFKSENKMGKKQKGASNCSDSKTKGENSSIDSLLKAFKTMETRYSGLEERMEKSLEIWKWSLNQKVKNLKKKTLGTKVH